MAADQVFDDRLVEQEGRVARKLHALQFVNQFVPVAVVHQVLGFYEGKLEWGAYLECPSRRDEVFLEIYLLFQSREGLEEAVFVEELEDHFQDVFVLDLHSL